MAPAGATDAEFNNIMTRIDQHMSKMDSSSQNIYASVVSIWDWIPPWLKDDVNRDLEAMWKIVQKVWDFLKEFFGNPGWPPALFSTGDKWTDGVGAKASSVAGRSTLNYVHADDHWTGAGATAYKNTLPAQNTAASSIKTICDGLDTALKTMGGAIIVFWLACLSALVSAIVEFVTEEAAADTGVGAPPAIVAFILSVGKLLAIISAAAGVLWAFAGSQFGPYVAMNQQLNNWTAFPPQGGSPGNWPRATNPDMSDGRFLDGSPSKWRFQE